MKKWWKKHRGQVLAAGMIIGAAALIASTGGLGTGAAAVMAGKIGVGLTITATAVNAASAYGECRYSSRGNCAMALGSLALDGMGYGAGRGFARMLGARQVRLVAHLRKIGNWTWSLATFAGSAITSGLCGRGMCH